MEQDDDDSMAGKDGDFILGRAQTQTPGLLRIKDLMRERGMTGRAVTFAEAVLLLSEAFKADGDWDQPAANMTLHTLDYLAVIGIPLSAGLYYMGLFEANRAGGNIVKQAERLTSIAEEMHREVLAKKPSRFDLEPVDRDGWVYVLRGMAKQLKLNVLAAAATFKLRNKSIDHVLKTYGPEWSKQMEADRNG